MQRTALILAGFLAVIGFVGPATAFLEEVNASSVLTGGRLIDEYGEPTDQGFGLLSATPGNEWFFTADSGEENGAIIELPEHFDLTRVVAVNSTDEAGWPGMSVRKMRLELGPGPHGPWRPLLETDLARGTSPQSFPVDAKAVRYVRFSALSNYGHEQFTGLAELQIWGRRSRSRTIDFGGVWSTPHGEVVLTQQGERITGCFGAEESMAGDNVIEGTLEGAVFSGTWWSRAEGGGRGGLLFALTETGELSGVWGNEGEALHARWDGTRKDKATIVCEKPEDSLAQELDRQGRVALRGILFDTGKDVIKPESLPLLESLAKAMQSRPERRYLIEGHTDSRGGEALNQRLSEQRAESVRRWLVERGIDASRLESKGHGMSSPVMPNDSEAGRAANRRVEVSVL